MTEIDPPISHPTTTQAVSGGNGVVHTPEVMAANATLFGTIQGIVAETPKGLGNDTTVKLLMYNVKRLELQNEGLETDLIATRLELNQAKTDNSNAAIKAAKLEEKFDANMRLSVVRNSTFFMSSALGGLSIDQFKGGSTGYGWLFLVMALAAFVVAAFFMKGAKRD